MRILALALLLAATFAHAQIEQKQLYFGYWPMAGQPNNCLVTVQNGVGNCYVVAFDQLCPAASNGGTFLYRYNPFTSPYFNVNLTGDVFILGAYVNVWDNTTSSTAHFSIQRDSDWSMLVNVNVENGRGTKNRPYDGTYMRLTPTDQFVFESTCLSGTYRVVAVSLIYTTTQP